MEQAGSAKDRAGEPCRPSLEEAKGKATCRSWRSGSASPPERTDLTPHGRWEAAKLEFVRAAIADVEAYTEMTVEEVVDEYRRAGKLHRYDPDTEWMKRLARVARKHPTPEGLVPGLDGYLKLLEEDESNEIDRGDQEAISRSPSTAFISI